MEVYRVRNLLGIGPRGQRGPEFLEEWNRERVVYCGFFSASRAGWFARYYVLGVCAKGVLKVFGRRYSGLLEAKMLADQGQPVTRR